MAALSAAVPPDVAALFAWAHIEDVPYRDFSELRREYRAGMRHRAALARRDLEAEAKAGAEQAAAEADHASRQAGEEARLHAAEARRARQRQQREQAAAAEAARERALLQADQLSRRAAAERMEAARHAEALRAAEQTARREVLELTRARAAVDQRLLRATSGSAEFGQSDIERSPGWLGEGSARLDEMSSVRVPVRRDARHLHTLARGVASADSEGEPDAAAPLSAEDLAPVLLTELSASETAEVVEQFARSIREPDAAGDVGAAHLLEELTEELPGTRSRTGAAPLTQEESPNGASAEEEGSPGAPSWIAEHAEATAVGGRSAFRETLQHSRETVASRWYALRRLFGAAASEEEAAELDVADKAPPLLAIYSIAGGVGKTSLAASLTRALAARGERVLLVDTTGRGLLPYYLGAREPRTEEMRTFAPPQGSTEQPIYLMTPGASDKERAGRPSLSGLTAAGAEFSRVVVDVAPADADTLCELAGLGAEILVPVAPDMNSAVSLPALKRFFASVRGVTDQPLKPAFLVTQFDASQPLQLDIRELFQQQLGDSLLPFALRKSAAVAEALAEGMTVVDYAPGEGVTKDLLQLAAWVRRQAEPAREGFAQARWSER